MTPELTALLRAAAATLPGDTPRLDAELLLAHAMGTERDRLILDGLAPSPPELTHFEALLGRRRLQEPVAYILGVREFWSLPLAVTPDVLIPRPDSETLIEAASITFADRPPARILDLGTGSGALLLAALSLFPQAEGFGLDRSNAALGLAEANAGRLGLLNRARFARWDWTADPWSSSLGTFDLLLCNPPYVPDGTPLMADVACFEPAGALYGGADGLDAYRLLFPLVPAMLKADGCAIFEFGTGQDEALRAMVAGAGLRADVGMDLGGRPRALRLRLP